LGAWLRKQPREVSVAFAARAALRVLPSVWTARDEGFKGDFFIDIVLPVFRASAVAWVTARYKCFSAQLTDQGASLGALSEIDGVFAKLKNTLRKMAHRTVDALWDAIGIALDDFSPEECFNYFRNAGYGST
jgi:hypothetical protein